MPRVRFEPTISVFERAKAVHALDRAATVIGEVPFYSKQRIAQCKEQNLLLPERLPYRSLRGVPQ
jgi:hypothetical protein